MNKILDKYTFTGFGFDVLLKNIVVKNIDGEEYPDINMNELKSDTAKALLMNKQCLNGYQLKFIRTFLKMSFDDVSAKIYVPASTLRSWENKGSEFTGFDVNQEKAFRIMAINKIFEREKNNYDIELALTKKFDSPKTQAALDIANFNYSYSVNE